MNPFEQAFTEELLKRAGPVASLATKAVGEVGGPIGAALNFAGEGMDAVGGATDYADAEKSVQKDLNHSGETIPRAEFEARVAKKKRQGKRRAAGGLGGGLGTAAGIGAGVAMAPFTGGGSLVAAGLATAGAIGGGMAGRQAAKAVAGSDEDDKP